MIYDTPYRTAKLAGCETLDRIKEAVFASLSMNFEADLVMSPATYRVFGSYLDTWVHTPDVLTCRLDMREQALHIHLDMPGSDGAEIAVFKLPFAELVLSAAEDSLGGEGIPPSEVSAMLRKLADQIDTIKED